MAHRNGQIVTFYSFKGGVGRTMALANIAWLLASTGRRVLTVDWDLESPGLHRYFSPFLADRDLRHSPGVIDAIRRFADAATLVRETQDELISDPEIRRLARVRQFATSLERFEFPDDGLIDFMSPGRQTPEYSRIVSNFNWDDFYERLGGESFLLALADDMRRNYDVALIDSRTGLSDNAGICTITLPDTVVNCFTFNNQSIEGAAAVSRSIRSDPYRTRDIRVLPVPTRVEDGETAKLDRRRSLAQQRFSESLSALRYTDPSMYWGSVEIPYKTFYAYEETLAAFGDPPHQQTTLLAAYERLAGLIMGEPVKYPGLPEPVRRGWLTEYEQRGSANAGLLLIGYTPRERMFAEWIAYQLRLVGQRSVLQDLNHGPAAAAALADAERAVVVLSSEAALNPAVHAWWEKAMARDVPGQGRFLVPVRVDGARLPDPLDRREPVDIFNVSDSHARDALLSRLGLRDAARVVEPVASGPSPRFPYTPARVWRVPARNNGFIGRDAALETLRERLNSSTAQSGPAVLQGIGGVGKTQIAVEYLHRFAADYDIAWWISADQPAVTVATALSDLARELQLPPAERADEQVAGVLNALRLGDPSSRWIIVFDNSEDPAQLRKYLPEGRGDVIVTTPGQEWSREAWTLDVNVFDRSESISLLSRRVTGLKQPEADAIAAKLGDLPLAVEQAASWLSTTAMSARNYLDLLDEHLPRILNEPPPPGYRHPAAETWRLSQERLRQSNPAAARLAEICAFLAPEPIPTTLLDNPATVTILAGINSTYKDQLLRGSLVREITRYGLARVDPATNALRMHRLVQSVLRSDLPESDQQVTERYVHEILAAEKRGDPADRESWPTYQGLLPHLEPSKALESDNTDVHQLTIDMVRYLRYRGDFSGAQRLAERAIDTWERIVGTGSVSVLRMRTELGNVLNAASDYERGLEVLQDVADRMSANDGLGEGHPYTLVALGGVASALRGLGQYQRARDLDEVTVVRWQAAMGDDHQRTLMARSNLATSLRLVGDFQGAYQQDQELVRRREKMHGWANRQTLVSRTNLGRDQRELGDLRVSEDTLQQTVRDFRTVIGEGSPDTAKAVRNLAVTLRRLGRAEEGVELIEPAQKRSMESWGATHPYTLELALEAARAHSTLGNHNDAIDIAGPVVKSYRDKLGDNHPVTLAAINDFAIFHLRLGDHATALPLLEDAAPRFADTLGPDHPNSLICQMNLANAQFAAGEPGKANQNDEHCHARLRAQFTDTHPWVLVVTANLALSMIATGSEDQGRALQRDVARRAAEKLGADHPTVSSIRDGVRISSHIDPPDV